MFFTFESKIFNRMVYLILFFSSLLCCQDLENISFGDASISKKHSNFFINKKNASFEEMNSLINFVKKNVKDKTGININLEIKIIE